MEGGHDYASLAQLTSFEALAETCGAVFAQAAALCGATSTQLADKLAQTQQQGDLVYAVGCMARAVCGRSRGSGSSTSKSSTSKTTAAGQPAPGSSAASGQHIHHSAFNHTAASPSINAANTSSAIPTALLCSSSCFNWGLAKQHLVRVLEKETQIYYAALVQAAKDRPFRLDPARTMTSLMFLVVLSMGVIEACQTLQTAAQAVLAPGGSSSRGSSSNSSSNKTVATPSSHSRGSGSSAGAVRLAKGQTMPPAGATSGATCASSSSSSVVVAGSSDNKAAVSPAAAAAASGTTTSTITTSSSSANHHHTVQLFSSSTWMLLRVFLMVDVGLRIWDALALQLPAACKSWAGGVFGHGVVLDSSGRGGWSVTLLAGSYLCCLLHVLFMLPALSPLSSFPLSPSPFSTPCCCHTIQKTQPSGPSWQTGASRLASRHGWPAPSPWWSLQQLTHTSPSWG